MSRLAILFDRSLRRNICYGQDGLVLTYPSRHIQASRPKSLRTWDPAQRLGTDEHSERTLTCLTQGVSVPGDTRSVQSLRKIAAIQ